MRRGLPALLLALALAACAPATRPAPPPSQAVELPGFAGPLPPMKAFGAPRPEPPRAGNAQIAQDFLELVFQMESGRPVPAMTRFEGPVRLRVTGPAPAHAQRDIDRLIARLRAEAGIDIARAGGAEAGITVEFLPRDRMNRVVPQAACFVVPRVASWEEFRRARRSATVDWTTLRVREHATVFIPADTTPQEIRDCLHEEVAQALGPLNDLYRLPDSVFNDDNFHTVLTGYDMLLLRAYYAPELRSGMTRTEVAARLPALLARLNPAGEGRAGPPAGPTPRAFVEAVETALGPRSAASTRRAAAEEAVRIARAHGWADTRAAFAWFALGRLSLANDMETALVAFLNAAQIYRSRPGMEIQAAHVDMQLAAFALSAGEAQDALALVDRSLLVVTRAENAALLSTLMMIRAEALELLGRDAEARAVRLDSLGWARYGFGPEAQVRARLYEIAALSPARRAFRE